jgi:hypothetical protein
MDALFMSQLLASLQRESKETYSTPTRPFLLSAVPLPHMVSPENTQVSGLKRNYMTNPASYHRSAHRKRGMSTDQRSQARQEQRLGIKGVSVAFPVCT